MSIQTHISVTAGRNFLILGMMMGYRLGMMSVIFFLSSGIPDMHTKTYVSKQDSHVMKVDIAAAIHSRFYPL